MKMYLRRKRVKFVLVCSVFNDAFSVTQTIQQQMKG
jgi:hypothetical protein